MIYDDMYIVLLAGSVLGGSLLLLLLLLEKNEEETTMKSRREQTISSLRNEFPFLCQTLGIHSQSPLLLLLLLLSHRHFILGAPIAAA
jgi:hypothetical protein